MRQYQLGTLMTNKVILDNIVGQLNKMHPLKSPMNHCDQCDYQTTQRKHLVAHMKSKHANVKYPCDQCDYKATQKSSLVQHLKSIHKGVKYPCDQCDYEATQKYYYLKLDCKIT